MPLSASLPSATAPVYCTDEDILVRAGGDFIALCPGWQQMAMGADGAFVAGAPWALVSTSVDFEANGTRPNQVVQLTAPRSQYPGAGQLFAIDSVARGTIVLRRPHQDLGVGQPPSPADGLSGVAFAIHTLGPQIEEASFAIKRRFAIDDSIGGNPARSSSWAHDLRDLRMATVLSVLYERYAQETRADHGDFALKIQRVRQQLDDVLSRVEVRWGPFGNSAPPSSIFDCRLSR